MELQEAIDTVKAYLPLLPNLGEKGNDAIALVMLAAMSYEEATWHYQFEVHDAAGAPMWLDGFPTTTGTRQRRFRTIGEEIEYGVWRKLPTDEHFHKLAHEEEYA
jgi:hypothetical protein